MRNPEVLCNNTSHTLTLHCVLSIHDVSLEENSRKIFTELVSSLGNKLPVRVGMSDSLLSCPIWGKHTQITGNIQT